SASRGMLPLRRARLPAAAAEGDHRERVHRERAGPGTQHRPLRRDHRQCGGALGPPRERAIVSRHMIGRRRLLGLAAAACARGPLAGAPARAADRTVRIGVQKYGALIVAQVLGELDKRLAAAGVGVEWAEFPGGPQLLEALAAGSIDFGTAGEAP